MSSFRGEESRDRTHRIMSICNPITMVSQKKEDISYPDMGCKHGKPAEVFRFHIFLKHIIQSNEEQNPLAVMRRPENGSFLLEQLKNWIANKSSGFNALKIISSLCQEPIYRSPCAGQQMAVTRYSISIHIEDRDTVYQGASKSQMLLWDAHVPPPKRVTSGGDWYIVSMEVFADKIDLGGRHLDNRNPEVHVKVTLHVANARRAWTPPALTPCVLNYHADYTLSPEELCQLVGPQKYFLPTEQQKDSIPTLNPCFLNHHADYTLSPEESCQLVGSQKFFLRNEQPKDQIQKDRILDPGPPKLNHAIHVDRRNLNRSRWSHYKSGDGDLSRPIVGYILYILLLSPSRVAANTDPQSNQVNINVIQDPDNLNTFNCILKIGEYSKSYGHCDQTKKFNATVQNGVEDFFMRLQDIMNTNQKSLQASRNSSDNLQLNLIWKLNKDFNVTNVTIQYTFNGKELTEKEIANLPKLISDPKPEHNSMNSSMIMEEEKDYVKKQWENIRKLPPFLEKSYLPGTTAPSEIAVSRTTAPSEIAVSGTTAPSEIAASGTTPPWVIALSVFLVIIFIIPISIVLCRKYGMSCKKVQETIRMMSCKKVQETISKVAYGLVAQNEAHGPNGMEAPERR